MPAPVIAAIIAAGATAGATVYSVKANQAAVKEQGASADKALAFQESEADKARQLAEVNRRAGYDQWASDTAYDSDRWAAREGRISDLGQRLGMGARDIPKRTIPAYVPMSGATGAAPAGSINSLGTTGTAGASDPRIAAFVADWQKSHPVTEGIGPLADALQKAGLSSGRFDYGGGKLSNNEVNAGGQPYKVLGGEGSPAAYWYKPGTNDSASGGTVAAAPYQAGSLASLGPVTPAYMAPRVAPGSLRALAA